MPKVLHPHLTSDPAVCGDSPRITGTRFSVCLIVEYVLRQGVTPEELQTAFPHLNLATIYDALAYYYDNREEIDAEIKADDGFDLPKPQEPHQDRCLTFHITPPPNCTLHKRRKLSGSPSHVPSEIMGHSIEDLL